MVLDAETVPRNRRVSGKHAHRTRHRRDGLELVLARDVGVVRELVRLDEGNTPLRTFPTVPAAVAGLNGKAGVS